MFLSVHVASSAQLDTPGKHCDHILETCLHSGDVSRWTVKYGMARELTYDEVLDLLKRCNEDGLVHMLNMNNCVCNCCNDCCPIYVGQLQLGAGTLIPSPFQAHADEGTCTACNACAEACPVSAIEVDESARIDKSLCIGCGVCVTRCDTGSMKLQRRPVSE